MAVWRGKGKYFAIDEIPERDYPLINRFLRELGSSLRLGGEEIIPRSGSS